MFIDVSRDACLASLKWLRETPGQEIVRSIADGEVPADAVCESPINYPPAVLEILLWSIGKATQRQAPAAVLVDIPIPADLYADTGVTEPPLRCHAGSAEPVCTLRSAIDASRHPVIVDSQTRRGSLGAHGQPGFNTPFWALPELAKGNAYRAHYHLLTDGAKGDGFTRRAGVATPVTLPDGTRAWLPDASLIAALFLDVVRIEQSGEDGAEHARTLTRDVMARHFSPSTAALGSDTPVSCSEASTLLACKLHALLDAHVHAQRSCALGGHSGLKIKFGFPPLSVNPSQRQTRDAAANVEEQLPPLVARGEMAGVLALRVLRHGQDVQ